jgi:hypothetical protein
MRHARTSSQVTEHDACHRGTLRRAAVEQDVPGGFLTRLRKKRISGSPVGFGRRIHRA